MSDLRLVFNPFTGNFDFAGTGSGGGGATVQDVLKAILLDSNQTLAYPKAEILFDEDSILFNDDGAL